MADVPRNPTPRKLDEASYRVCMVCTGNICRSPMAAVVLRHLLEEAGLHRRVQVDSAGTDDWHVGDGADRRALAALRSAGYDGSSHRAAQFEASWLASRDLVLVADRGHLRVLRSMGRAGFDMSHVRLLREFDAESVEAGTLDVDDPYYGDPSGFDRCLAEIVAACRGVVDHIQAELAARDRAGDRLPGSPSPERTDVPVTNQDRQAHVQPDLVAPMGPRRSDRMHTMYAFADDPGRIALGALDGRYRAAVAPLVDYLSEAALNRMRVHVEVEWLIELTDRGVIPAVRGLTGDEQAGLRGVVEAFDSDDVAELAAIERETVHDVKAVEYYLRRRLPVLLTAPDDAQRLGELLHFACTSEDINNTAYALMVQQALRDVWLPAATALADELAAMARAHADVPMLAHTHGQPATPTTLGKEYAVAAHRLRRQLRRIAATEYLAKFNGATGTYGAHLAAVPGADWPAISRGFVERLGLTWNPLTTQIESHDWQAELYADLARYNRILHNVCTDTWTYISMGYFAQVRGQGTVGSSTMPHKVNPIRFENAEANLEVSCALLDVLGSTLVTSRLQRDLTDSSMQRNIGTAFGHSLLAIDNVRRGLTGLDAVPEAMAADLDANWEVLGEPVQTVMRALGAQGHPGMEQPYERLKAHTRGRRQGHAEIAEFVRGLGLPDQTRDRLLAMTPASYVGLAPRLVADYLE